MKRILLLFLLALSTGVYAQKKEVLFKVKFMPDSEYTTTVSTNNKMTMSVEGPEEKMSQFKTNGLQLPMILESRNDIISTIATGSIRKDKSFPAVMQYGKMYSLQTINGEETAKESPISGLVIKGNYDSDSKFKVDTIISDKINDVLRSSLKTTFENLQQQIPYPDSPMKIGDVFDQKIPMSIPIAGMNPVSLIINTTYKLKNIKGDIASFDIIQKVEVNMSQEEMPIIASGSGSGVSEFDIKKGFMTKYESDMEMNLTMAINDLTFTTSTLSKSSQQVEIK